MPALPARRLVLLCALLLAAAGEDAPAPRHAWHFEVLLEGQPVGTQDYSVGAEGDELVVHGETHLRVTALLIPVYRYEFRTSERWRGGCLERIDAETHENGSDYRITGARSAGAFQVTRRDGQVALPACVKSFAYWDPAILGEQRLLNAQSGAYEPIAVQHLGRETLVVAGRAVEAQRSTLTTAEHRMDLWYSAAGEWLALEIRTRGHTVRYRLRD